MRDLALKTKVISISFLILLKKQPISDEYIFLLTALSNITIDFGFELYCYSRLNGYF